MEEDEKDEDDYDILSVRPDIMENMCAVCKGLKFREAIKCSHPDADPGVWLNPHRYRFKMTTLRALRKKGKDEPGKEPRIRVYDDMDGTTGEMSVADAIKTCLVFQEDGK